MRSSPICESGEGSLLSPGLGMYLSYTSNVSCRAPNQTLYLPSLKIVSNHFAEEQSDPFKKNNIDLSFIIYLFERDRKTFHPWTPKMPQTAGGPKPELGDSTQAGLPRGCQRPNHFSYQHCLPGCALAGRSEQESRLTKTGIPTGVLTSQPRMFKALRSSCLSVTETC